MVKNGKHARNEVSALSEIRNPLFIDAILWLLTTFGIENKQNAPPYRLRHHQM
jgi:hypothetical protein